MESAATAMPAFSGATRSTDLGISADKTWWDEHRTAMAGMLRIVSHSALIASGLGIGTSPSNWRIAAGMTGLTGAASLATSGATPSRSGFAPPLAGSNVIDTYAGLNMVSGLCLLASGIRKDRKTEALAGAWAATAFAIKKWMPENEPNPPLVASDMPAFDAGAPVDSVQLGVKSAIGTYLDEIRHHPIKLGADMLQASAAIVMADAIVHRDPMRAASAVCLALSNYAIRETRRGDYQAVDAPQPGR